MKSRTQKPKRQARPGNDRAAAASVPSRPPVAFPVVGVGASAGGMESFAQLFRHVPPDSGMAFVLIQHLDPRHPSYLGEALARSTPIPVSTIEEGMRVEPDHVYVIPSDADVGILQGRFTLLPRRREERKPHLPIDFFFQALAADRGNQAIGVVLSGTGSDGTEGLRAIKAEDGVTFVQDPRSAKFSGMPESAIQAGTADVVLPVPELATELLRIGRHPFVRVREAELLAGPANDGDLRNVLVLLRSATGVDFSEYKQASIRRRLARRMALHKLGKLKDYVQLLRDDRTEAKALFEDILIHVTSFFREKEAFERLKKLVFPEILKGKREGEAIRIWVAGCSTGEEAYSILIALFEYLAQERAQGVPVQLFGTDISEKAIEKARAGGYADSIVRDVDAGRLERFFTKLEGGGYRINKNIRERCAFVKHDLASDPPFSKLDLVSCRNVLIYFDQDLQRRVLSTFQFALKQPGFLLLGRTESIPEGGNLFSALDKENKIFARMPGKSVLRLAPSHPDRSLVPLLPPAMSMARVPASEDLIKRAEGLLLDQYAPAGVIVNGRMEILHFRGRTGPYLEPAPGYPQNNLFKMARKGLVAEIRIGVSLARKKRTTVRRPGVRFAGDGEVRSCDVVVVPMFAAPGLGEDVFAVLFEEVRPPPARAPRAAPAKKVKGEKQAAPEVARLEDELKATKDYLQSIVEEHQHTNEELMATNEELVSSNEELQSLNEELETAKEELQSTNEELSTLNEEVQTRNDELNSSNSDLVNILGSVEVPIAIVDGGRRIRRFTPKARTVLNLLPVDIGRPIGDIKPNLAVEDLDRKIVEVIDTVAMKEEEVQDKDGRWYRLQIRPYTTIDKRIDGAVLSLIDIDALKRALGAAEWARDYARATVDAVQEPLLLLDERLKILSANGAFHEQYGAPRNEVEGRELREILGGAWDVPDLQAALRRLVETGERFQKLEVEREVPGLGKRSVALSARPVPMPGGAPSALLALEDITDRLHAEAERTHLLHAAEEANRTKDDFLATLSHELRTPLSVLVMQSQLLRRGGTDEKRMQRAIGAIERAARTQTQLIDDLLDVSRITAGKLKIDRRVVSLEPIVRAAAELAAPAAEKKEVAVELRADESLPPVLGDPARLQQVVLNLLTNAIKFTPGNGRVTVTVDSVGGRGRIQVADTGIGIDPSFLPRVFHRFTQEDRGQARAYGGLGLGLTIARHLVEAHGGTIQAESAGKNRGSTFTVLLPLLQGVQPPGPEAERRAADLAGVDIKGVRILVVEDDVGTRDALTEMLGLSGAEVMVAGSAEQALELFGSFKPEILICDIALPGEDGYSLLGRIRALGPGRGGEVPALALTALASEEDRRRAFAAGFQAHLAKPVDIDRLVVGLADLLGPRARVAGAELPPPGP